MVLSEIHMGEPMVVTMVRKHLDKGLRVSYGVRWPTHNRDDLTPIVNISNQPKEETWTGAQGKVTELVYVVSMSDGKTSVFPYTFGIRELESMEIAFVHDDPTHMVFYRPLSFE